MTDSPAPILFLLDKLRVSLASLYTPPFGQGGHDIGHILRMIRMYDELSELIPGVSQTEYETTVWLHNIDRTPAFAHHIKAFGLKHVIEEMLEPARLAPNAMERIVTAVLTHSKKDDGADDSALLQMLRLADKWDRIGVHGATSGMAWKGNDLPSYDPDHPFGYGSTAEGAWKSHYQNFYRILEWYTDFPLIRELVRRHPHRMKNFLFFVRAFAAEISEAHEVPNTVEDDIRKCLGIHYDEWKP